MTVGCRVFLDLEGFFLRHCVRAFVCAFAFVTCCEKPRDWSSEGLRDGQPPRIDNISLVFQTSFLMEARSFSPPPLFLSQFLSFLYCSCMKRHLKYYEWKYSLISWFIPASAHSSRKFANRLCSTFPHVQVQSHTENIQFLTFLVDRESKSYLHGINKLIGAV